jgi:thiosulfate/3-mercaptopyruvate sulfurtransferase
VSGREIGIEELASRLDDPTLTIVDVRRSGEYDGSAGSACDPRQGHLPGARHVELARLLACGTADEVHELVGREEAAELAVYCHSGSRSATAAQILDAAGYEARNYRGSWHEWSRSDLPIDA